jgi:hypothetical protein
MSETGTGPAEAKDAATPNEVKQLPFDLKEYLQQILGYAGFAYVVGFLTLVANTARYGVPAQELSKPLTIWAGAIPTVTIFLTVLAYGALRKDHPPASLRQIAGDLFVVAVSIAVGRGFLWYVGWFFRLADGVPIANWVDEHSLSVAVITGIVFFIYMVVSLARKRHTTLKGFKEQFTEHVYRYGLSVLMAILLVLYVWVGYPHWPQQYGFGHPLSVRLLVDAENSLRLPLADPQPGAESAASGSAKPELRLTAPVELLFKTEKEYVLRYHMGEEVKIVSIDSGAVKGTIWK